MTQRAPPYLVDPDDPRAPAQDVWDPMTPEERQHVVDSLPSEFEASEAQPPERSGSRKRWRRSSG